MIGLPNFDLTNQSGKQKFVEYVVNLMRNEIIAFTTSYNDFEDEGRSSLPDGLLVNNHRIGLAVNRPIAGDVTPGTYYTSTDVDGGTTYRSDGIAYTAIAAGVTATGPAGPTGPTGATGATGASGAAATIAVGTTTTGAPGSPATVTNVGTSAAAIFNFSVPEGAAGVGNPAGAIIAFGGTTLPSGYLWCDGTPQSKTTYATLYATLGVNRYGIDTATDFYLPNLISHLPRGAATTGGAVTTNNNNTHGHGNNATTTTATTIGNPTQATTNIANPTTFTTTAALIGDANNVVAANIDAHGHGTNNHNHAITAGGTDTRNHDHSFAAAGGHSHSTGGPSANINRGASGALSAVSTSGHTHGTDNTGSHNHGFISSSHGHTLNAPGTNNDGGANTGNATANSTNHAHSFTPVGNITSIQINATNVGGITNGAITNGAITMGTITTGTVIDNTTYVPAFVEVNYIIKT